MTSDLSRLGWRSALVPLDILSKHTHLPRLFFFCRRTSLFDAATVLLVAAIESLVAAIDSLDAATMLLDTATVSLGAT
ncbi:hypothetical protein DY000_02014622 [Brassica cretica]|uniref:Uncharacterized protein n=1 Tax=Brassica cretica TaxID=69181 RepID=A0ABQ7CPI6_BRACR|nr:hypothetical protein DY000_02014622 [Brassica cretica]